MNVGRFIWKSFKGLSRKALGLHKPIDSSRAKLQNEQKGCATAVSGMKRPVTRSRRGDKRLLFG
jgi:hypothetical protein